MIKAEELRHTNIIGDEDGTPMYVNYLKPSKYGWRYVDSADNTGLLKNCNGLLLNAEWLLKFGFVFRNDHTGEGAILDLKNEEWKLTLSVAIEYAKNGGGIFLMGGYGRYSYKYVHQLQNLYYALTGQELTITL